MPGSRPHRPRNRRLVVVCTAGILSLGAFAPGPVAQASEPGTHAGAGQPARTTAARQLHPAASTAAGKDEKTALSSVTKVATPAPVRLDRDGDGVADQISRSDGTYYISFADDLEEIGTPDDMYVDVLAPGDLDSDAEPDLLATTSTGRLELFSGFGFPYTVAWSGTGWNTYNKIVAVDDLSGDGRADIVARDYSGNLYLYQGTGDGSAPFAPRVLIGSGWGQYDQLTGPGDIDGDGISDLVARDASGTLWRYKATGSAAGPFAPRSQIGTGWNRYNQLIGRGNDAAGEANLWGQQVDGKVYAYLPDGAGGFAPPQRDMLHKYGDDLEVGAGGIPYWGKKALLAETPNGTLYWYDAYSDGDLSSRWELGSEGDWADHFSLVEANALTTSGHPDSLDLWNGELHVMDQDYTLISSGWGAYNLVLGPGDLSGDGNGDLLGRDTSGHLYVFPGDGTGRHLAARQLVGGGWDVYNAIVGSGDFSGDGRADIVARDSSGTLYLYKGTGNAAAPFSGKVKIGTGWGQYSQLASPGDMDGDGRADLVAVDSAGTAYRYSATGTGEFKARVPLGSGWNSYKKLY
jgi:hypothetical protein